MFFFPFDVEKHVVIAEAYFMIAKVTDENKSSQFFTKEAAAMNWDASINNGAAVSEEEVRPLFTVTYKAKGGATGIKTVKTVTAPVREGIYSLSGQRLSHPVKGINIINGKKVVIRNR